MADRDGQPPDVVKGKRKPIQYTGRALEVWNVEVVPHQKDLGESRVANPLTKRGMILLKGLCRAKTDRVNMLESKCCATNCVLQDGVDVSLLFLARDGTQCP